MASQNPDTLLSFATLDEIAQELAARGIGFSLLLVRGPDSRDSFKQGDRGTYQMRFGSLDCAWPALSQAVEELGKSVAIEQENARRAPSADGGETGA